MPMEHKYSKIVNREKKQTEMLLYGYIGEYVDEADIDGNLFARELNWLGKEFDEALIRVNGMGGDVMHGLSIISEIRSSKSFITTRVDGAAGSMSGVIAISGDKVQMHDYARIMLHSAYYTDRNGNRVEPKNPKEQKALDQMNGILADILSRRGKSKEEIQAILEAETWYNAEEALAEGFIDEIIDTKEKKMAALDPLKLVAKVMETYSKPEKEVLNPNNQKSMKKIAARLGLQENATEEQILAKMKENATAEQEALVAQFVTIGKALGTITEGKDGNEEKAKRLAKADMELAVEMYLTPVDKTEEEEDEVDEAPGSKKETLIKDLVNKGGKKPKGGVEAEKFEDLTADQLEEVRAKEPKRYAALYKARYGFEPEIED